MQIRYNAIRRIVQTGRNSTSLPFCVVVFARTEFSSTGRDHCTDY